MQHVKRLLPSLDKVTAAFDVDDTLYKIVAENGKEREVPNLTVIELLQSFHALGCHIIVWSGGGRDYAKMWVKRLWLDEYVHEVLCKPKEQQIVDIAVDDQPVKFGKVNILV